MGRRHFNSDGKPDLGMIVGEILSLLAAERYRPTSIYLIGGYGRAVNQAHDLWCHVDPGALVGICRKSRGDVDVLIAGLPEEAEILQVSLRRELNDDLGDHGESVTSKDFRVDPVFMKGSLRCRKGTVFQLYPEPSFEYVEPSGG